MSNALNKYIILTEEEFNDLETQLNKRCEYKINSKKYKNIEISFYGEAEYHFGRTRYIIRYYDNDIICGECIYDWGMLKDAINREDIINLEKVEEE